MKTFTLPDRSRALYAIIDRNDVSAAEIRICKFLLIDVMNQVGNCRCSDRHIARRLSIKQSTVYRSKLSLRAKGILDWKDMRKLTASTQSGSEFTISTRLLTASTQSPLTASTQSPQHQNEPELTASTQSPQLTASTQSARKPRHGDHADTKRYAGIIHGEESHELQHAAADYRMKTGGKQLPRDTHGGAWVDDRYFDRRETLQ